MTELQKAQQKIANQQKYIDELLVLIDTAQAGLRRAESTIKNETDKAHVFNQSAKWVLNFKP